MELQTFRVLKRSLSGHFHNYFGSTTLSRTAVRWFCFYDRLMNMNNEQKLQVKVTAVTIMYGDRWKFLSQVVEAVMRDPYITTFVIVDNGSKNKLEIEEGVKVYGNRVVVLRQEKNLGSAGGFAKGLEYARTTDSDFVFLLDDDSVPEDNTIEQLLYLRKLFKNEKVVLSASRPSVPGNIDYFYKPSLETTLARRTFFEVFSFSKFENFIRLLIKPKINTVNSRPFIPIRLLKRLTAL